MGDDDVRNRTQGGRGKGQRETQRGGVRREPARGVRRDDALEFVDHAVAVAVDEHPERVEQRAHGRIEPHGVALQQRRVGVRVVGVAPRQRLHPAVLAREERREVTWRLLSMLRGAILI